MIEFDCADCGEPMLLESGDRINYRIPNTFESIDGMISQGKIKEAQKSLQHSLSIICYRCNKMTDPEQKRVARFVGVNESQRILLCSDRELEVKCRICCNVSKSAYYDVEFDEEMTHVCKDCKENI